MEAPRVEIEVNTIYSQELLLSTARSVFPAINPDFLVSAMGCDTLEDAVESIVESSLTNY